MTAIAERLKLIERSVDNREPRRVLQELFTDLREGLIKAEEITNHYRDENIPRVRGLIVEWQNGRLFKAQTASFEDFLGCRDLKQDIKAWLETKATFWMAQMPIDPDMGNFACCRFWTPEPSIKRRACEDHEIAEILRQRWTDENRYNKWDWRKP